MENCKALIFDCYGTLIDWERGMVENLEPLLSQKTCPSVEVVMETMGKAQHYIQGADQTMPYPIVLQETYKQTAATLRLGYDDESAEAFGQSVGEWRAFEDSAESLARLRALGLKLVVLSNVDNASFSKSRKKLESSGGDFDSVYTAEEVGSYKPDLRNFRYALDHLAEDFDIQREEVLSVANSKLHDVEPAKRIGILTAWINRPRSIMGVKGLERIKPDYEFRDMADFADAMEEIHIGTGTA